ncbi:cupin domain-containing protein [Geothrix sp. 21YS21S-2]|uniref:cupin domain-containing protein n=1 Tax=Geothrix sp. 21YS21S-2 TaxID=3068893 RepID=UPI0027BA2D2D|nr:cupin domain-containing protein [Geothrix sp. 21YS21S-2]
MKKRELKDCTSYDPPRHFKMAALRLQGKEESGCEKFWMGLSHFLPGGGAEFEATPAEKIYFVVEGEVVVTTGNGEKIVLRRTDSIRIGPDEGRSILNESNLPASMLVVINYPA